MDADYDIFEIVAVIRDFWLVDAESYQRRYCTKHGQPLSRGYYVVNWPEHVRARRFNEHAAFHGPFLLRKEAQAALDCMHKESVRVLNRPSEISPVVAPNASRIDAKKAASYGLRLVHGAKAKPLATGASPPCFRKTTNVAVH